MKVGKVCRRTENEVGAHYKHCPSAESVHHRPELWNQKDLVMVWTLVLCSAQRRHEGLTLEANGKMNSFSMCLTLHRYREGSV